MTFNIVQVIFVRFPVYLNSKWFKNSSKLLSKQIFIDFYFVDKSFLKASQNDLRFVVWKRLKLIMYMSWMPLSLYWAIVIFVVKFQLKSMTFIIPWCLFMAWALGTLHWLLFTLSPTSIWHIFTSKNALINE